MERILLFIPAYNCERQLPRVLAQINAQVMEYIDHVLVGENCSTDNTLSAAKSYMESHPELPATLVQNNENYGYGGNVKMAFAWALQEGYDYVIILHGDDQGSINDLLPLLEAGAHKQYDCLLGARFMPGASQPGYSRLRNFGNRVFNLLFSLVCHYRFYEMGSGLNLYSCSMLQNGFYEKFPDDLTLHYCMCLALAYYKQSAKQFPITWREEDQISNVKLVSQGFTVLRMLMVYAVSPSKFIKKELRKCPRDAYPARRVFPKEP